ncbi:MAG: GntR family transcriptional regulator, partial [Bdellovibrionales bacterium]|nr:GntR family transcriptional regulator [Bdellovibrionales bacterium]
FVTEEMKPEQMINVFIARDSEDRLVATTENPKVIVGGFAVLKVLEVTEVGAFLDWGLSKDLFLPFSEQLWELKVDDKVVVTAYLDKTQRITASMRVEKYLKKSAQTDDYKDNQPVDIILYDRTDLGFKAIVEQKHSGLLYENQVFKKLNYGNELVSFVKKVRADGKIDLLLLQQGHHGADPIKEKIIELLRNHNGFYPLTEKTTPEEIYKLFGVSKKKYKVAIGGLYKSQLIEITEKGLKLVS